jgi:hypothetical protein
MKRKERELNIFSLSLLDIISCAFGAIVMLILIAKPFDDIATFGKEQIQDLLDTTIALKNSISKLQQDIASQQAKAGDLEKYNKEVGKLTAELERKIQAKESVENRLAADLAGLSLVESTLKQASIQNPESRTTIRDDEVGGIPVDSDYVIFVVDTSGSMRQIWSRVSAEIVNVLNIHPQVKGFQVINDMGKPLVSGYEGKWIPDTQGRRDNVIQVFRHWADYSNSNPVEGIEMAIRRYAKPDISTSIYVFGDDYTGSSYDPVIERITSMNTTGSPGKRLAKIHGIGFISIGTTDHFSILMRELTKRNGGTYLALPR